MSSPEINSLFEQLESSLKGATPALDPARPIYIYGAGNMGKEVCRIVQSEKLTVTGFLDRNATPASTWERIPILPPDTDKLSPGQRQSAQVILGVFNRDADTGAILALLESLGYGRVISFLEFHDQFQAPLGDRFWLTSRDFYLGRKEEITAIDQLWSDDSSRELYRALLRFRFTMRDEVRPTTLLNDQYFPSDIPAWPSPLRFADCGAYDGDTLRHLVEPRLNLSVEAVTAFEPDLANFHKLASLAQSGALAQLGDICLIPCAVGGETKTLRFSEGQGEASSISESGTVTIQCVTLDSALVGFRPNLVKMDIEGSELDALTGAEQILRANRPGLAICVYHRAGHLWEIPIHISGLFSGGQHFLRAHAHNGFDVVYYWVP